MWVAKRVLSAVFLVWLVVSFVFLAIRAVPGDPAVALLSRGGGSVDPEIAEQIRHQLGLDQPILTQYATNLVSFLHGDLGVSMQDGAPVGEEIGERLPRTLELVGMAAVFALLVGIPSGLIAGVRPGLVTDRIGGMVSAFAVSVPNFVVGTLFVLLFAITLHWVPAGGYVPFARAPLQHLLLVSMPAGTVAIGLFAMVFRMTRSAVADVAGRDHVRTARSKGLTRAQVLISHILRNALTPIVTTVALNLGVLVGNAILVEYVFNYPGLSSLLIDAVNARDYTMVQGAVLVIAIGFVGLNLLVELGFLLLDPRLRQR